MGHTCFWLKCLYMHLQLSQGKTVSYALHCCSIRQIVKIAYAAELILSSACSIRWCQNEADLLTQD